MKESVVEVAPHEFRDTAARTGTKSMRLLVSVRDVTEALEAMRGGADIIDVKEPRRGALGMADPATIEGILHAVDSVRFGHDVSAALGEVREWRTGGQAPALPRRLAFAKLGLAGLVHDPDWIADWLRVRAHFDRAAGRSLPWVAVAYADAATAASPAPRDVIRAAARTGCRVVLIDTFDKTSGGLLHLASIEVLRHWSREARRLGLAFAVAGRLAAEDIGPLRHVAPDVVGVRSAACESALRDGPICARRVAALRTEVGQAPGARLGEPRLTVRRVSHDRAR